MAVDFSFLDDLFTDTDLPPVDIATYDPTEEFDLDYSYDPSNYGIGSFDVNDLFSDFNMTDLLDDNYNFTDYSGPGTASDQIGNFLDNMYDDKSEFISSDVFMDAMNNRPGYGNLVDSFLENKGLGSLEDYLAGPGKDDEYIDLNFPEKPGILDIIAGFFGADRKGGKDRAQGIMQGVTGGITDFANSPIGQLLLYNYLKEQRKDDIRVPIGAEAFGDQGLGSMPDYRVFNIQPALMPGVAYANAPPPGMKHGGVHGAGKDEGPGDITLARLEPGEFVMTRKATDNIGAKNLYNLMKQAERMG
jgi:hypothetical protein